MRLAGQIWSSARTREKRDSLTKAHLDALMYGAPRFSILLVGCVILANRCLSRRSVRVQPSIEPDNDRCDGTMEFKADEGI